ncbi:crossover junction endodeoxyribonuclease [Azospirillum thiophilum]|uniref:Crossover junction endodeoxyribonuclease RuvC n=1 Tax=Azospirillum thiophilum TaxID=528244 RepID=A0AAC8ZU31_9PROT|nr:crossover junction endodeoxyribonuclease [Azospirillum thiophilum]KJR65288.1 crossover junction endodeoxyribonuclease [Azospirillum thiophilum]
MRLLGIDPGLRHTGWGIIDVAGNRLTHVADGAVHSDDSCPLAERLVQLHDALSAVVERYGPDEAAVEETFVNSNAVSTLKLGQARAVALLVPAQAGLAVAEYANNMVKKAVVGQGRAEKAQVQTMVRLLLPGCEIGSPDAADALAVAICHAHHRASWQMWRKNAEPSRNSLSPPGRGQGEGDAPRSLKRPASASPSPRPSPRGGEGNMARVAQAKPTDYLTERARDLRMNATDVEKIIWQRLRNAQLGAKFRRQEPILGFVADFVAHDHRLIVELDGGQHAEQRASHDERRTRMLEQAGFRILRFWNTDVIDNLDGVLETIRARLAETPILRSQPSGREFP